MLAVYLYDGLESFLEWFTGNTGVEGWQETATDWVISAIVVAAVCAGVMSIIKLIWKKLAPSPDKRIWPRRKSVMFILSGLMPVFLAASVVWYLSRDFVNIMTITGLMKGIVCAWVLYLFLMLLSHSWGEWREDVF